MTIDADSLRNILVRLPLLAKTKLDEILYSDAAFDVVGIGADNAPTSRLDHELEKVCLDYLSGFGVIGSVLSEEAGLVEMSASGHLDAILDPLDGTSNAKMGFPYYALSLALLRDGEPIAGMVFNYASQDLFLGILGHGASRNGRPISVSKVSQLRKACVVSSRPLCDDEMLMYGRFITNSGRVRISSSPALDIAHVACGTFSAYADYHAPSGLIHLHDVIAAKVILEEAGGQLLNEFGEIKLPSTVHETFNVIAVNTLEMYREVVGYFHP
ncbi:inositol monophosphatase family protein [Rhizobium rhizogenes]|uniref:inositol monophosphatase family protein n=1 Tax=Rhizobium rhizogenes TaxID=359 RepID=UPI00157417D4|nr:inositol monophosphatase family protein [Rhizobium rhizogenes]NTI76601.1 hypothetical protein [Rhizobium rhizogenes]